MHRRYALYAGILVGLAQSGICLGATLAPFGAYGHAQIWVEPGTDPGLDEEYGGPLESIAQGAAGLAGVEGFDIPMWLQRRSGRCIS
jgi:hypothetical protein